MKTRVLFAVVLCVLLCASPGIAKEATVVEQFSLQVALTGLDGKALAQATIEAYDADGVMVGSLITGAEGTLPFGGISSFRVIQKIRVLYAGFQTGKAVCWEQTGSWEKSDTLEIELGAESLNVIQGVLVDEKGAALGYGELAFYNGDVLLLTSIFFKDESYELHTNAPVTRIVFEGTNSGLYVEKTGEWKRGADVDLDLSKEAMFTVSGKVLDDKGEPYGAMVEALNADKRRMGWVTANAEGAYMLRSNTAIASVATDMFGLTLEKKGPFATNSKIDLDLSKENIIAIEGVVTDENGEPVRAEVVAHDDMGEWISYTATDEDGSYRLLSLRDVVALSVRYRDYPILDVKGPWDHSATVNAKLKR